MFDVYTAPARFNDKEITFQIWKKGKCMAHGTFFVAKWDEFDLEYLGADIKALIVQKYREIKRS